MAGTGRALVFLRRDGAPLPPGCAGHTGWGFQIEDGGYIFGSTENTSGAPVIAAGSDNGAWHGRGSLDDAVKAMRKRHYDAWKLASFRNGNPAAAWKRAQEMEASGYVALGNNCLDHTFRVLESYGQPDLPWPMTHPSPNDWFAVYNGEFHNID